MVFPIHQVIFYVFTVLLIASATMMITSKNAVKAALLLVMAFFASSVLWMLMQAEFLSLVLIFVYVGAVMTLFLFVIMMLRTEVVSPKESNLMAHYPFAFLLLFILVAIAFFVFVFHWSGSQTLPLHYGPKYSNVMAMGTLLFLRYLLPFFIAAVLLLVGMIAAIALAFHGKKSGTKSQSVQEQLSATKKDRLRVINLRGPRT